MKVTVYGTLPQYVEKQKGDVRDTLADVSKSREMLKWKSKISIADGLMKYIESIF